jgi:hypothetical protein
MRLAVFLGFLHFVRPVYALQQHRTARRAIDGIHPMEIYLVSSLTPDDESRLAPTVLAAIGVVLDSMAVPYAIRVRTTSGEALHRSRTDVPDADALHSEEPDGPTPAVS